MDESLEFDQLGRKFRRKLMLDIAASMNTTIKRGQDKLGLATTVYDWVRRPLHPTSEPKNGH